MTTRATKIDAAKRAADSALKVLNLETVDKIKNSDYATPNERLFALVIHDLATAVAALADVMAEDKRGK